MLDRIPLGGAARIMRDGDGEAECTAQQGHGFRCSKPGNCNCCRRPSRPGRGLREQGGTPADGRMLPELTSGQRVVRFAPAK